MIIPPLRSDRVLIVGKGPGSEQLRDFLPTEYNIWTIPQTYSEYEYICGNRFDLIFEVHQPNQWRKKKSILRRLNACSGPRLMVPQIVPGITNNSYSLPVSDLQALELPLLDSFAWMLAYALYRDIKTIALRGINLDFAHEAAQERDALLYILGYLKAAGLTLDIDRDSGLVQGNGLWTTLLS